MGVLHELSLIKDKVSNGHVQFSIHTGEESTDMPPIEFRSVAVSN